MWNENVKILKPTELKGGGDGVVGCIHTRNNTSKNVE